MNSANITDDEIKALFEMMSNATHQSTIREELLVSDDPNKHVCSAHTCPYLRRNVDDTLVCTVTGYCYGQHGVWDATTAGRTTRTDENGVTVGKRSRTPRLKRRRPSVGDAQKAKQLAVTLEDEVGYRTPTRPSDVQVPTTPDDRHAAVPSLPSASSSSSASSASSASVANSTKRPSRPNGPVSYTTAHLEQLRETAAEILDSLTASTRRMQVERVGGAPRTPNLALDHPANDGGSDVQSDEHESHSLFLEHGRRYLTKQTLEGLSPTLDDLHNIALQIHNSIEERRKRRLAHDAARAHTLRYIRIRDAASQLAVALWVALLRSPYMEHCRRTGDSFKPFVSTVFMNMRNGVFLKSLGVQIVPTCTTISNALPEVRSQHTERRSHSNHLSAHRGAYTLHHGLSSVPGDEAEALFEPARRISETIQALERRA